MFNIEKINKKSITIFTLFIFFIAVCIFELGYCNVELLESIIRGTNNSAYNFSLIRVVVYVVILIIYMLFKDKFIDDSLKVIDNKYKRIFIYISTIMSLIIFIIYSFIIIKNPNLARGMSIGMLAVLMWNLFIIYVSNNIIKNVIIVSILFGVIFSIATDFNHAIDEKKHFMTAFNVANFNLDYINNPITDKKVEELPQLSKFTTIDKFLREKYVPEITNDVDMADVPSTPTQSSFCLYLFPAIGIWLSTTIGGTIIDMYILGRIFNIILYVILIYTAIKIIPFKKNIFAVIFCMPYMLLLASSYSLDGYCIGLVAIFIAYCLKIYKESDIISLKQFIILIILFVLMLIAKSMAYIFVACITLILPITKTLKENKKYIPIMLIVSVLMLITIVFTVIYVKNTKISSDPRGSNTNVTEQIDVLITNPKHDIILIINHLKDSLLNFYWLVGLHPTYFFTNDSSCLMFILLLYILYVAITEDDYNFKLKDKIIMILSFLLVYGMTSIVLYISFTAVNALHIAGYQTRYIVPILPLVLFSLSSKKLQLVKRDNRNMNLCISSSMFIMIGIMQLLLV